MAYLADRITEIRAVVAVCYPAIVGSTIMTDPAVLVRILHSSIQQVIREYTMAVTAVGIFLMLGMTARAFTKSCICEMSSAVFLQRSLIIIGMTYTAVHFIIDHRSCVGSALMACGAVNKFW